MNKDTENSTQATQEAPTPEATALPVAQATTQTTAIAQPVEEIHGFEDTDAKDIVIPRVKVINALSPERQDGTAEEGDIINSLTKEVVFSIKDPTAVPLIFIPIRQYYSNIEWNPDRNDDTRIFCMAQDGKVGTTCDDESKICSLCKRNQFDNSKKGKEAQPMCTAYLNFLGFFEGNPMPVVISFAKTNYNEGKKMLSIAKSMRSNIWDYGYKFAGKKVAKDRNTWYIITAALAGETSAEDRILARQLFGAYENTIVNSNYEDTESSSSAATYSEGMAAEI